MDDSFVVAAAKQLAIDRALPIEVAQQRIAKQLTLADRATYLQSLVGDDNWGGAYFEQDGDGGLVAQATSLSALNIIHDAVPAELADWMTVSLVKHSYKDLAASAASATKAAQAAGYAFNSYYVDVEADAIAIVTPSDTALKKAGLDPSANQRHLSTLLGLLPYFFIEGGDDTGLTAACMTSYRICDPPLRGGIEINATFPADAVKEICTTGFMVRSKTDQKPYVLTAGHCVDDDEGSGTSNSWATIFTNSVGHNIGVRQGVAHFNGTTQDFGIVGFTNAAGWSPEESVLVQPSSGGYPTTLNEHYSVDGVKGVAQLPSNAYLCKTGAATGTNCGPFIGTDGYGRGEVNMYSCGGDSGAPIYVGHYGYGLLVAVTYNQSDAPTSIYFPSIAANRSVICTASYSGVRYTYFQGLTAALSGTNTELIL